MITPPGMNLNLPFVFRRGDYLYAATTDGQRIGHVERLLSKSALLWDDELPLWAVSPDGRHIAFQGATPPTLKGTIDLTWPQTVYIGSLPDLTDRRLLFSTAQLQDTQGRRVTSFPPFTRLPHQAKDYPLPEEQVDGRWDLSALRWSRSGKHLYASFRYANTLSGFATCAVDSRTGAVITDSAGHWRRLLPTGNIDESADYLIGAGSGRTRDEPDVCNGCSKYYPLYVTKNKETGIGRSATISRKPISLLPTRFDSKNKPPYAFASDCAISPTDDYIVFGSEKALWLTSVKSPRYSHLVTLPGSVSGIAWVGNRSLIYGLRTEQGKTGSLWTLRLGTDLRSKGAPRCLLQDVMDFTPLPR